MSRSAQFAVAIAVSSVVLSCSNDASTDNAQPNAETEAACASIAPSTKSGQPLDALPLSDEPLTPEVRDNLWLEYEFDSEWYPGVIEGQLEPVMIVPVHPNGIEGGTLRVRFIDGLADSTCGGSEPRPIELNVEPLTPAPGELERYTTAYTELLDTFLAGQGLDRQTLVDGPIEDVPVHVMPALVGWGGIADPSNPNSFDSVIQPDGPWADLENFSQDLELVEALIAKADVVAELETAEAEMAAFDEGRTMTFERVTVTPEEVPSVGALTAKSLLRTEIEDISTLSYWMQYAQKAKAMELAANKVNTIATYLGIVPIFSTGANIAGLATVVLAEFSKAVLALLPNKIDGLTLAGSPETYLEDQDRRGQIIEYRIVAESGRWKFNQAVMNILIEILFLKLDSAVGDARKAENVEAAASTIRERARNGARERWGDLKQTVALNEIKAEVIEFFDSFPPAAVGPFRWGPFELAGTTAMFLDAEGPAVSLTGVPGGYESIAVGTSTITASVKGTEFPPLANEFSSALDLTIEVKPIDVSIEPPFGLVTPGDSISLTGIVRNAENDALAWDAVPGRIFPGADTTMATLEVPADLPDDTRIVVTATSNSNTGLRTGEFRKVEREGTAIFHTNEQVELVPGYQCVEAGSTVEFTARVAARPGNEDLEWDASEGQLSVSPNGLAGSYIAPANRGTYQVTASLISAPEVADTSYVEVGDCACFFEGRVFGAGAFGGPNVQIDQIAAVENIFGSWPDGSSQDGFVATAPEGDGRYTLLITMPNGEVFASPDDQFAQVEPRTEDGEFVSGTLTGPVFSTMDRSDPPLIYQAQIRFRGLLNPEFGGECLDRGTE